MHVQEFQKNPMKGKVSARLLDTSFQATRVARSMLMFHMLFLRRVARPKGMSVAQVTAQHGDCPSPHNACMSDMITCFHD
jgi:hypothetical protein